MGIDADRHESITSHNIRQSMFLWQVLPQARKPARKPASDDYLMRAMPC
jgi:hypothetical protein